MPAELRDVRLTRDPLADLDAILRATALDPRLLQPAAVPFRGGWIGCFSYDLGRVIEPRAAHAREGPAKTDVGGWPLIELAWCPDALVFDHLRVRWTRIGDAPHPSPPGGPVHDDSVHLGEIDAETAPGQYEAMVARTIEYIAAGDVFQANISQRFHAAFDGSTRALALAAFSSAQPWYGAYLESPGRNLLSLSPELFLQTNPLTGCVITRPIKGTRPISCDPRELRDSIKDEAELNMIVDLMRNDLGRVCEYGSVKAVQPRMIETHPTVHHGVAEVAGVLRENMSAGDVLRATFPPGSVTGAPKIRAMQIIDELESAPPGEDRGPYCGAIGFISDCGAMTLNVAIRTLLLEGEGEEDRNDVLRHGRLTYSAGAGIVADSVPARELQETLDKTAALRNITAQSPIIRTPLTADR